MLHLMAKDRGQLVLVPASYNPAEVLWAMDGRTVVGMVIASDVHNGRYRAGVYTPQTQWLGDLPVSGTLWICVQRHGEALVDKPQAGTEEFLSVQDALAAIARNRIV
ncbi:hypothetical protein ACIRST_04530 [Kitasatospora sp. NPDC101447]|uniref:hypothetical protein n=1 Tax=Kitasatospora sp. NPDC101447 TaxID=3364102 RepID=UPI0038265131